MTENLPWLFGAFSLGWLIIFGYLGWISSKERSLTRRIASLQRLLEREQDARRPS